jgi:hypothetical protein
VCVCVSVYSCPFFRVPGYTGVCFLECFSSCDGPIYLPFFLQVVYAGAPLDWADDKGRTALDYAKEGKKIASVVALERIVADFQASLPNGRPPAVPRYRPQERRGAGKGGGGGKTGSAVAASLLPAIDEGGGKVGGRRVGGGGGGHRPMTQQVRRREKMVVRKNSRTQTIQPPKYALDDPLPDDYTTSSGESGDEQEELTAEERRRINIAKFMYLFNPPLTPLQVISLCPKPQTRLTAIVLQLLTHGDDAL